MQMDLRFAASLLLVGALFSGAAWSAPAAPIEIELTQPDGTTFIAVPRGDEFASWTETKSGHSIVRRNDVWFYAKRDAAGNLAATDSRVGTLTTEQLRAWPRHLAPERDPQVYERGKIRNVPRKNKSSAYSLDQTLAVPHAQNVLTILVDYADISFTFPDASFQALMYGATDSVTEYFLENSYGSFTIVPAAESQGTSNDGIVHVARAINHPNLGQADWGGEARAILQLADGHVDFAAFDTGNDGAVSPDELSIVIILAGYETSFGGDDFAKTPNVWGHASSFASLVLDSVSLSPYAMFGESHGTTDFPAGDHQATIGIMCHELGHLMFNLPDLYDVDGSSAGIGDWALMAGGAWNFALGDSWTGETPAHMAAWAKTRVGFTVPEVVDTAQAGMTFANADANESAKMIWIDKYRTANGEYLLLENRQLSGYDAGLPGAGLMIWHIDQGVRGNSDETRKLVDLEEADGLAELDANTSRGDDGDPYPGATNNTVYDDASAPDSKANTGIATGIAVGNISASMATMTADLQPASGPVGDHVRYDEDGFEVAWGLGQILWIGSRVMNDTGLSLLEGIDLYIADPGGATLDISFYGSMAGGTPADLIHAETGIAAESGWNRLLFSTPQPFPNAAERGIVVKIVTDGIDTPEFSLAIDDKSVSGICSGRSYIDLTGSPPFDELCSSTPFDGDLNLVALFGAEIVTPGPNATAITPTTAGPTNADSVAFDVTFDMDVVNFNDAGDLTIDHAGTAHGGVSITGSGASYTATVTGITGDGSFTLQVDTGSDVQDGLGNPLESSVTSPPVAIDNTPPAIGIGAPSEDPAASGPVSYLVSYTDADVVSLVEGDITLNRTGDADGSVAVTGAGSATRTVTISGITGNGTLAISIAAGTASDTAGNTALAAGPSSTFSVENPEPEPEFDSTPAAGATLAFNEVLVSGTSSALTVVVENLGNADLTLSCGISGADAGQFDLSACPSSVESAGSVQLDVTCSPDSSGEKTASLDLNTNDADEPGASYQLTCTGVEALPELILQDGFEVSDAPPALPR